MAVTTNDYGVRFIQITLGEVGISRDRVSIDGFEETGHQENARHFMKSWSEFDRSNESWRERDGKA